jgi:hypothetical protein
VVVAAFNSGADRIEIRAVRPRTSAHAG